MKRISSRFLIGAILIGSTRLYAAQLTLAEAPLYTAQSIPPMVMMVMGRDHTLYYEAYNDTSDLNHDGQLNIRYSPNQVDYDGYFDSYKCYSYSGDTFTPIASTSDKKCSGTWSGDWLNYVTMSRIDILRKVLYGGYRSVDYRGQTVLERSFIPLDAHSWAKSYYASDSQYYRISDYTPLSQPLSDHAHFFGTATFTYGGLPTLKIVHNAHNNRDRDDWGVWNWASTEGPVLSDYSNIGGIGRNNAGTLVVDDYTVRVAVCVSGQLEQNCKRYIDENGNVSYKPTGLLHEYGESGLIDFGLITGSFNKNLSGGVLRKNVSSFADEINTQTGQFNSNVDGIVDAIDKLRIQGFNYNSSNYSDNCGWVTNGPISDGKCASWGNPIGEMLYESLRYFNGPSNEGDPTYTASASYQYHPAGSRDAQLGLSTASWKDPFASPRPYCSVPHNIVISDINPSYDSDQLPGAHASFSSGYSGPTLAGFNAKTLLDKISAHEGIGGNYFIGESLADHSNTKNAPTAKAVQSLSEIRGLSPQEPTKGGSYTSVAAAHYGFITDLHPDKPGLQNIKSLVVALSSPLPEVKVDVDGNTVTIVPFAKSVGGGVNMTQGAFQPTNTIVDYYVEEITPTQGTFRINFEDVEQGADHDMDMIVRYHYQVVDYCTPVCQKALELSLSSTYAEGSIDQHAGYVISGTDRDGIYLDVYDVGGNRPLYYLDTPATDAEGEQAYPNNSRNVYGHVAQNRPLGLNRSRIFVPRAGGSNASFLKSPLWYAAKWGNFDDKNGNGMPDGADEWDSSADGIPDSFYPVTNAGELRTQLSKAFIDTLSGRQSAVAPVYNTTVLAQDNLLYRASFDPEVWSGEVSGYEIDIEGNVAEEPVWKVSELLAAIGYEARSIFSRNDETGTVFEFKTVNSLAGDNNAFSATQLSALLADQEGDADTKLSYVNAVINYLRGDQTHESALSAFDMRKRESLLGDVINSTPYYVGPEKGHDVDLSVLVFGANDGMVHVVNSSTGKELAAYIPTPVYNKLARLTSPGYSGMHTYFVDGGISAYSDPDTGHTIAVGTLGGGAKGLYAIDVTNMRTPLPSQFKWEITPLSEGFSGIGYISPAPTIAKLQNGKVGVIFSNGYNPANGTGQLYIADLYTGELIATLSSGVGADNDPTGQARPNTLSDPAVIDLNGDGIADRIYSGDLYGNLWSFTISNPNPVYWGLATEGSRPLFQARSRDKDDSDRYIPQPITTRPSVGVHPSGLANGVLVAFGTGKYIEPSDNNADNQPTQSVYALWDRLDGSVLDLSRSAASGHAYTGLLKQEVLSEDEDSRVTSENYITWAEPNALCADDAHCGWFIDLYNTDSAANPSQANLGERQVSNSVLLVNKLAFTTLMPNDDPCAAGGSGWYMEIDLYTGAGWSDGKHLDGIPTGPGVVVIPPKPPTGDGGRCEGDECDPLPPPCDGPECDPDPPCEGIECEPDPCEGDECGAEPPCEGDACIRTCVTLSNGAEYCSDDPAFPTGRLSWRQLY